MSMWTDGKAEVGRVREEKESVKKMIKGRVVGSVQPWGPGAIILSPNSWGLDPRPPVQNHRDEYGHQSRR